MAYVSVMASLQVADLEPVVEWYGRLFRRAPDRSTMEGVVEWALLTGGTGLQLAKSPDGASPATFILSVDDIDAEVEAIGARGIEAEPYDVPSGQFRLAQQVPAGNTVVLAEERGPSAPQSS